MTSLDHHHRHHHHRAQHHQLGMRLCQLDAMSSSTSADTARWFRDDELVRCQSAHRHGNASYPSPFFQHAQLQRRADGSMSAHSWPFSVDGVAAAAAAAPWSLHPGGTPPWTATVGTRRPGSCRALEAWPVADNAASPITTRHHHQHHHHQPQQQYPQSPDDVSTPVPMHKYPWMSIIGELCYYPLNIK